MLAAWWIIIIIVMWTLCCYCWLLSIQIFVYQYCYSTISWLLTFSPNFMCAHGKRKRNKKHRFSFVYLILFKVHIERRNFLWLYLSPGLFFLSCFHRLLFNPWFLDIVIQWVFVWAINFQCTQIQRSAFFNGCNDFFFRFEFIWKLGRFD